MTKRTTGRIKKLAAFAAGLLAGLMVVEAGLRIVQYSRMEFYEPDKLLGYRLIPGVSGAYRKEGRSSVVINSRGFRDEERPVEKPDGVYRIAVIGDSYVEALQVERLEMFTALAEQKLTGCAEFGGRRAEVLSFGVSGYGTAQELIVLREHVLKYSPDLVILAVTTNNDVSDNLREFKGTPIPYFVPDGDGLRLDDSFLQDPRFVLKSSWISRAGAWFKQNLRSIQGIGELSLHIKHAWRSATRGRADTTNERDGRSNAVPEAGIDSQVYREPVDANWQKAWLVTERLIAEMAAESREAGARFAVMTLSNGVQVLPAVEQRDTFARTMGVDDLFYPDRRIAQFCRTRNIPTLTLAPQMGEFAARDQIYLHGFDENIGYGHWNEAGHRAAAELLSSAICSGDLRGSN